MIEGYLKNSPNLSAVVVLPDSRRELDERDVQLIEWLRQYDIPVIYALTKIDKLNRQETDRARRSTSAGLGISDELVLTSAKSGQGIKELWDNNKKIEGARSQNSGVRRIIVIDFLSLLLLSVFYLLTSDASSFKGAFMEILSTSPVRCSGPLRSVLSSLHRSARLSAFSLKIRWLQPIGSGLNLSMLFHILICFNFIFIDMRNIL